MFRVPRAANAPATLFFANANHEQDASVICLSDENVLGIPGSIHTDPLYYGTGVRRSFFGLIATHPVPVCQLSFVAIIPFKFVP